ncbi:MAG: hypothetical protein V3W45_00415 [Sedimentisphaerales bacterium]
MSVVEETAIRFAEVKEDGRRAERQFTCCCRLRYVCLVFLGLITWQEG